MSQPLVHLVEAPTSSLPEGFVELEAQLYAQDPHYIPRAKGALERAFSAQNPWFAGGNKACALSVPGAARLAVYSPSGLEIDGLRAGFFGCFEAASGAQAEVNALMDEAIKWAKARGLQRLYGPIDFNTYGPYRLRTDAEPGAGCFIGEPYSLPHYPAMLERTGASIAQRYVSQITDVETIQAALQAKLPLLDQLQGQGFTLAPLTPQRWLERLDELHGMIDDIFGANFAYTPLSLESFKQACGPSFIQKADPERSVLLTTADGRVGGFWLVYPDYSPLVSQGAGDARLSPDQLSYEPHAAQALAQGNRTLIFKTVGVRPDLRRLGLMDAMSAWSLLRIQGRYDRLIGALIREDNPSRRFAQAHLLAERGYTLYSLILG